MSGKSQPTSGAWRYNPSQSRQVVADTGETVCKIHRGKKAQHNGPLIAAAKDSVFAAARLMDAADRLRRGDTVPDLDDRIAEAQSAIAKAKGETE